jgi:hypothetical protein
MEVDPLSDTRVAGTDTSDEPSDSSATTGTTGVGGQLGRWFRATEVDPRLLGMLAALVIIWVLFNIMSGGTFLTARNLWFLSLQTSVVAIMATGMVLIIVTISIGVTEYHNKESLSEFIKRADQAMYLSKEKGRNTISSLFADSS